MIRCRVNFFETLRIIILKKSGEYCYYFIVENLITEAI